MSTRINQVFMIALAVSRASQPLLMTLSTASWLIRA
jgi:hypothetical protein